MKNKTFNKTALSIILTSIFFLGTIIKVHAQLSKGDGSDGAKTFASGTTNVDNIRAHTTGSGSNFVNISNNQGSFAENKMVLIIQMITANCDGPRNYEFRKIQSIQNVGSNQIKLIFSESLTNSNNFYSNGQVIQVPQYSNVSFASGAHITCQPWNGFTGGVVPLLANGTITFSSTDVNIDANYKGFMIGTPGVGGAAGLGGLAGTLSHIDGFNASTSQPAHFPDGGGQGIGGAGWGGDKGDYSSAMTSGTEITVPGNNVCCGCDGSPKAKNHSFGNPDFRLLLGGAGKCGKGGNGGYGGGGAGYDGVQCTALIGPGESGQNGGKGGDGANGGRGGGIVIIRANQVLPQPLVGFPIEAKGENGFNALAPSPFGTVGVLGATGGGKGGNANPHFGAGGGNGGNGGQGGGGGNGGAGGWVYIGKDITGLLNLSNHVIVAGGSAGLGNQGGAKGAKGLNAAFDDATCPPAPCDSFCRCDVIWEMMNGAICTQESGYKLYTKSSWGTAGSECKVFTTLGTLSIIGLDKKVGGCRYYCDMSQATAPYSTNPTSCLDNLCTPGVVTLPPNFTKDTLICTSIIFKDSCIPSGTAFARIEPAFGFEGPPGADGVEGEPGGSDEEDLPQPPYCVVDLKDLSTTTNTLEFDVWIHNYSTYTFSVYGASFGVNFNPIMVSGSMLSLTAFQYLTGTASPAIGGSLNIGTDYHTEFSNMQLKFTAITSATAVPMAVGDSIKVGRFRLTNTVPWPSGIDPLLNFQIANQVGKVRCEVAVIPNGATNLIVLSGPSDGLTANVDAPCFVLNPASITVTVSSSLSDFCISGTPTLTASGSLSYSLEWQSSTTSATGPWTSAGIGSNTFTPNAPLTQTTYFRAIAACTQVSPTISNIITVTVNNPTIASTNAGSRCGVGTVSLGATANGAGMPNWFANPTGGTALGTGTTFTTPSIASTTTYYVGSAEGGSSGLTIPGDGNWNHVTTLGSYQTTILPSANTILTVLQPLTLSSFDIYPSAALNTAFVIEARTVSSSGPTFLSYSGVTSVVNGATPSIAQTLPVNWVLPVGTYYIGFTTTNPNCWRSGLINHGFPWVLPGYCTLDYNLTPNYQYYFYNLSLSTGCVGTRTPVVATVVPPPTMAVTTTASTICAGESVTLSVTSPNDPDYTYTWNPGALTGASITVSPTSSTVYTLTAIDNTVGPNAGCANAQTTAITVNPILVTVNPVISPSSVCPGANVTLSSNAIVPGYSMNAASTTTFVDISTTGTDIVLPSSLLDDSEHNITIPSFTFNGVAYTTARVGVNGLIVLGSTAGEVGLTNATLPSTTNTAGNVFFAPYWDDLDIQTGLTIKTQTIGNVFIIQYTNAAHNNFITGGITFQVQMDLVTGVVTYIYSDVTFGDVLYDAGANATIGIQMSATSALQHSFNTISISAGQAISFTPNNASVSWSGPNGFSSALSNPVLTSVTNLEGGSYAVTAGGSNGCSTSSIVNLTVKPNASSSTSQSVPCAGSYVWNGNTYTASGTYTFTAMGSNGCDSTATLVLTVAPCNTTLNLTVLIEGYWDGTSAMLPVLMNQGEPFTATQCDHITVELRDLSTLTGTPAYTTTAILNTNGNAVAVFPSAVAPGNYYIVVKHRNALQTWSSSDMAFPATASYNFTTAASQAYGANQIEVATGVFAFYSGDIAVDENIDPLDEAIVNADLGEFVFGYLYDISNTNYPGVIPSDINGDGNVDLLDAPAIQTNLSNFIFSSHP